MGQKAYFKVESAFIIEEHSDTLVFSDLEQAFSLGFVPAGALIDYLLQQVPYHEFQESKHANTSGFFVKTVALPRH